MRVAFSLLLLFLALLDGPAFGGSLRLCLPPVLYAVPGVPMSLYFDNVVLTEHPERYRFEVTCELGTTEERRWTVTPDDKAVGDHMLSIVVKDASGATLEQGRLTLHVSPKDAGQGQALKLLIVGDSLTNATVYPNEIARLFGEPGNPALTMLGTHKTESARPGVLHEGYGGWKWAGFLAKFAPMAAGVTAGPLASKATSPFIFPNEQGKGVLDLARYFRESCGGQTPDVVTFLLGINDCFGAPLTDDAAMLKHIDDVLDNADKLLAAFHLAVPQAKLAVGLTTPPNARESGFEANYKGKYHRWGWKQIQHRLVERMMERLSHREAEQIYLVPTEVNLDPVDGYPNNNGVHPNAIGYAQIGVSFYAWMKALK